MATLHHRAVSLLVGGLTAGALAAAQASEPVGDRGPPRTVAEVAVEVAGSDCTKAPPARFERTRQAPASPRDSVEEVWRGKCKMCHGPRGDGSTEMGRRKGARDFTDPPWQQARTDGRIRCAIRFGRPGTCMRGFEGTLTAGQLDGLVELIRSFGRQQATSDDA